MTFFNRKEEVIQVQLTRVGRQKLAIGKFIPKFYEFLDDDVLYDKRNFSPDSIEEQNDIKDRIKEKVSLRSLTAKQSVPVQSGTYLQENRLIEGLGTFIPYSNYRPAWKIDALDGVLFSGSGEIDYSSLESTANNGIVVGPTYEKIPQLSLVCEYHYNLGIVTTGSEGDFVNALDENPILERDDVLKKPEDDTYILFRKDFNDFSLIVEEENVLNEKEGFTLEFFKYEYSVNAAGDETVEINPLFVDGDDENSANWYFDITTDEMVEPAREGFTFVDEEVKLKIDDDECVDL